MRWSTLATILRSFSLCASGVYLIRRCAHLPYTRRVSYALILVMLAGPLSAADEARRDNGALALIRFPWEQLHYAIVFAPPRPGLRAMIFPSAHRIEIYARP